MEDDDILRFTVRLIRKCAQAARSPRDCVPSYRHVQHAVDPWRELQEDAFPLIWRGKGQSGTI